MTVPSLVEITIRQQSRYGPPFVQRSRDVARDRCMRIMSSIVAAVGCLSFPTLLLVLMLLGPHLSLMTASAIWAVLGGVTGLLAINAFSQPMSRPNPNPPKSIASQGRTLRAWPVIPNLAHELLSDYASLTVSN